MTAFASEQRDYGEGAYLVRGPRVTDAVGGALQRSFAHAPALPDDMRRLVDRLDRSFRTA